MNAGLRGHQFVKKGAKEVLELGLLVRRVPNLSVDAATCLNNVLLLILGRQENGKGLQFCGVDAREICGLVRDRKEVALPVWAL